MGTKRDCGSGTNRNEEATEALTHEDGEDDAAREADGKPLQPGAETQGRGVQGLKEEAG